jgi:predicted nuclease with RNAse H fold
MKPIVVAGIDLAGSPKRPTGACLLRGLRATTALLFEDEAILEFIRAGRPALVTIDAPLNLPPGRRSIEDRNGEHYRPCDLELRRRGIPFFPITLGPMRSLTTRGINLRRGLEGEGFRVLEMYPGGAQDVWGLPRARRDPAGLRRGRVRLGLKDLARRPSDHELDAATGALIGRFYLQGRAQVLGDFATGAILMPLPPGQSSASVIIRGKKFGKPGLRRPGPSFSDR